MDKWHRGEFLTHILETVTHICSYLGCIWPILVALTQCECISSATGQPYIGQMSAVLLCVYHI